MIVSDSQFTLQNGVTGGRGTRSDPFLIEGWSIAAPDGQAAIRIASTTAYFSVRHVQLLNAQPGIYLTGISNGQIENSTFLGSSFGIRIESSTNILISGNNISGYYGGVYVADGLSASQTTGLRITNNTFSGAGAVVDSSQSAPSHLNITGNTFLSTEVSTSAYGAIVIRNNITGSPSVLGGGLTVEGNSSFVSDNLVSGGDIQVWGSGTIVKNNRADRILLYAATRIILSDNVLTGALLIPTFHPFDTPPFYDSHIMTGNTVNGKPLIYLAKCSGASIDGALVGEVILASCTNVRVANLRLSGGDEGIMMVYVHQGSVLGNSLSGNIFRGIEILHSSNLQISKNNFTGTEASISDTDNMTMTGNHVMSGNVPANVTIARGNSITVSNNTLEGGTRATALTLADVTSATVAGNWVSDSEKGVLVDGANGLNITENNIVRNRLGLTLSMGTINGIFNGEIYHNNFVDNVEHQAAYYPQVLTAFDNGYPSGGNYWSDYRSVDNCSGLQQNICTGPDGIGDRPYTGIWELTYLNGRGNPGTLLDRYPLVSPYGTFSWDSVAPIWPIGSRLTVSIVNSTSLRLEWTSAIDDAWVSGYRVYQDNTLLTNLPRYVQNYTVAHLSPGSTHMFKVEAGDPSQNWSTDGPSATATLPQTGTPPTRNPPSATQPVSTMSWLMDHWYVGIITASIGISAVGVSLIQRRRR